MTLTKNSYKFDTYRFSIEPASNNPDNKMYNLDLDNVISWDMVRMSSTREELKGLADFINKYLENK